MESSFKGMASLDEGFYNLNDKADNLIPIIQTYCIGDLVTAVFAITSWRDNRSAQESCIALNRTLINCSSFGNKPIETYEDFADFFQIIEPLLRVTHLDDTVINDFGEVQVCVDQQFYPVITGTGHTGSVYSAVRFLECISSLLGQQAQTKNILDYQKNMIDALSTLNVSQYDDFPIVFDIPTREFFYAVKSYIRTMPTKELDAKIFQILMQPNEPTVKTHFIQKNNVIFPLFNPSLILDYYTNLLQMANPVIIKEHIHTALRQAIEAIHLSTSEGVAATLMHNTKIAIDQRLSSLMDVTFLYAQGKTALLFIDVDGMANSQVQEYTQELRTLHEENRLGFVDLCQPVGKGQFCGIVIKSDHPLDIIPFNHHTNLNEAYIQLSSETDITIFTAVDLMLLLMMAKDVEEIVDFVKYRSEKEPSQIFSWGLSDIFTLWKQEKGYISKGAVEYNMMNVSFETTASYVFDKYSEWKEVFPFHLKGTPMGVPEQWEITLDENNVYQFARKGMNPQGGAAFLLENGGFIFSSYDFLSVMRNQDMQNVRSWRDLVSGINKRFVLAYQKKLSQIEPLNNVMVSIQCNSLNTAHENGKYVETVLVERTPSKHILKYTVDTPKLMKDISNSKNREIESQYLLELLGPFFEEYPSSLQSIRGIIINDATRDKTVDIVLKELDHYMNPDYLPLRLADSALLDTRKTFAKIAAQNGVIPGKYAKRKATDVVRQMQISLVNYFEQQVCGYERLALHANLLHYYSSELLNNRINSGAYGLTDNIDEALRHENKEKLIEAREKNKQMQSSLLYLIETNLFLTTNRGTKTPSQADTENLVAFSHWLWVLQSHSDMCFHTTADTHFIVLDDYRVNVELGEKYQQLIDDIQNRSYESRVYDVQGDEIDKQYFEKVNEGFLIDTGMDFRILESVLRQLMECSFPDDVSFTEIKANVIRVSKDDVIKDYSKFVMEAVPLQTVRKAFDFLTLSAEKLKSISDKQHPILPIWERRQRNERFDVKPLLSVGDSYIYSPVAIKELHSRWTHGLLQFYPPYEIGLDNALSALWNWKERYEQQFSIDIRDAFRELNYSFAVADVEIHKRDRAGNHPTDLGDYDVLALDMTNKTVFVIECKVLQPVGSVFEHSMQQKGFFQQNKYDEKFQKRIDYLKNNYRTFFNNIGYELSDEDYEIRPFMVVNKVFASYYKGVSFPIVTFDELKKQI